MLFHYSVLLQQLIALNPTRPCLPVTTVLIEVTVLLPPAINYTNDSLPLKTKVINTFKSNQVKEPTQDSHLQVSVPLRLL